VLEIKGVLDTDIEKGIADDLRAIQTCAFLADVSKSDPQSTELDSD